MGIKIKKLEEHIHPYDNADVKLKKSGNIFEIKYMSTKVEAPIRKLDADSFIELSTGEVKEFEHDAESRVDNIYSIRKSMANLRDIINANTTHPNRCRWVTLTYRENVTDTKRIYEDFRRFWQRFKRRADKEGWGIPEYIAVIEAQARGAWHYHIIFVWKHKAPFIENSILEKLWKYGFTSVKKLDNVDNVGAYLTAYLADLPIEEALHTNALKGELKSVQATEDGKKISKAIVKGARLALYPAHFNFYRTSRGIKRPLNIKCTEQQAQRLIGDAPLTYEKTIEITENGNHINTINYRVYNKNKVIKGREKYEK